MNKKRMVQIGLFTMIISLIAPLVVVVVWAFAKVWSWPNLIPELFGLRSFIHIFDPRSKTFEILVDSVLLSTLVTVLTVLISIPAGKALGQYDFKGKSVIKLLVLAPLIVPAITVAMGIHVTFIKMGLANKMAGVVLIHMLVAMPYGVRIFTNYFEIMGTELEESASNLGATGFQTFLHVTLPMITPALVSAGSLIFIVSFSQYILTFLIGGGRVVTLSMVMMPFIQSGDRMMASAYSILFVMSTLFVLAVLERSLNAFYKGESFFSIENH